MRSTFLEELTDPADNFSRALCVFYDSHGGRARLFDVWSVAREPAQARTGVGAGRSDWLIHFVCQGNGQLSHRGHPGDACEIRLRLAQSLAGLFRVLTLGDVHHRTHELLHLPRCVQNGMADGARVPDSSVRQNDSVIQFVIRLFH